MDFLPSAELLTTDETERLISILAENGVRKIRYTLVPTMASTLFISPPTAFCLSALRHNFLKRGWPESIFPSIRWIIRSL